MKTQNKTAPHPTQSHSIKPNHSQSHQKAHPLPLLFFLTFFNLQLASGATVTGTLVDIGLQPFNTKIVFTPTNEVQVSSAGLSAGSPKILDITNGSFSLLLDTGDYAVSLPFIPSRRPFMISVADTNGTLNITNLISSLPLVSTNNPNYTVKATATDTGPGLLNAKIHVAGSLTKLLSTNAGAVTITLSNSATASALDNDNVHIGADGSFSLANNNITGDTAGNLAAHSFTTAGDIEITDTASGLILKSPGGTRYRIKVTDDGTLSIESVP